uniref:Uncharacterized protein n=1 Tax=Siphoviridae sp. ctWhx86 TaxID=2826362 RepID=A0A8S5QNJ9_9CAUD|nr:MAG TPA: hypothetical protein [Siphoviridae sp. ctWhx86]
MAKVPIRWLGLLSRRTPRPKSYIQPHWTTQTPRWSITNRGLARATFLNVQTLP